MNWEERQRVSKEVIDFRRNVICGVMWWVFFLWASGDSLFQPWIWRILSCYALYNNGKNFIGRFISLKYRNFSELHFSWRFSLQCRLWYDYDNNSLYYIVYIYIDARYYNNSGMKYFLMKEFRNLICTLINSKIISSRHCALSITFVWNNHMTCINIIMQTKCSDECSVCTCMLNSTI